MRQKIAAGNWKMHKTLDEGVDLAKQINDFVNQQGAGDAKVILAPPFIHLTEVLKVVDNPNISVSAQNCAYEQEGAFTGEVSADMIRSTGATYTIIGHSERRSIYKEDDETLQKKVDIALDNGLRPIFCVGETLEERDAGKQSQVVKNQLSKGLFHLDKNVFEQVVIAYEPVWAIGTGKHATPEQAEEMHKFIRDQVKEQYGDEIADNTSILYGGSIKPSNAETLFSQPDVDGGLVGGASLKPEDFTEIIKAL